MTLEALLSSRPRRRTDLGPWYAQVLDTAARDKTSISELAKKLNCSRETIYAWRRRLTKSGRSPGRPAGGLVRVQVTESERDSQPQRIEVRTRGGRSVIVPQRFDPADLATLITVLERC